MRGTLAAAAVLLGVAAFELAAALGAGVWNTPAWIVAVVAMLVGAFLSARWPSVLLAPAAAVALLTHWYGYDPYYAPLRRRYSDGGLLAPAWVYAVLVASLVLAMLTARRPREAGPLTSLFLVVTLISFAAVGAGH